MSHRRQTPTELADAIAIRTMELAKAREMLQATEQRLAEESRRRVELASTVEQLQAEVQRLRQERNEAIDFAMVLLDESLSGFRSTALEEPPSDEPKPDEAHPDSGTVATPPPMGADVAAQLLAESEQLRQRLQQTQQAMGVLLDQAAALEASLQDQHLRLVQAARRVAARGSAEQMVPALIEELASPYPEVRRWAAMVLESLGPDAHPAIGRLTELLSDPDPAVRRAAEAALLRIRD
ncbi:MAG: hypothetical protein KatS3mg110_0341 [Pirellulaceae bacterium]|nr:MAG: hypothetical protein KatS3mg110_0341 [Pirellulaceae bacterium]